MKIDMWHGDKFVKGKYYADAWFGVNGIMDYYYWGNIYGINGKIIGGYTTGDGDKIWDMFMQL